MRAGLIPIGQMAAYNRVSVATLRLYDRLDLLKPRWVDPQTGYRYYDLQQNARLDMIAYMKELGMQLAQIQDVFRREDISLIEEILAEKNEQIHAQIRDLRARHDAVERAIDSIERYRKSPATGTLALEYIDRRLVWGIPCAENFYDLDIRSYEAALADLRKALAGKGIQQIHTYSIGTTIRQADFEQERMIADRIFIFLNKHDAALLADTSVLDSGMYACIYLDNYDDEIEGAKRLRAYCSEQGYHVAGDYVCEVMTEFNVFDSHQRSMFIKLQVPVAFLRQREL